MALPIDPQPSLNGPSLNLSPLRANDYDGLFAAASNPKTWEGHPATDRYKPEVFKPYFEYLLSTAETLVVRSHDKIIGCSRYYQAPDKAGQVCIGFTFLSCDYWGGATNFELKRLMLEHAFKTVDSVWLHIAPGNIRSQKAAAKIGAVQIDDAELLIGKAVSRNLVFEITREVWMARVLA
ncbi:MAG: GNAT family N-acetyltransferase [Gammaproteobacteria bacterium]|nr:GNAT family N-acetyltransferase [Gammaproteobacteria bacterium]